MAFTLHPQLGKDSLPVAELALCEVRLINDSQYPWLILVPRVPEVKESIDLSFSQQRLLSLESAYVCQMLRDVFKPDKLNVAAIGNKVAQLHIHHIARFTQDTCWPNPVWGQAPMQPYSAHGAAERIDQIVQYFQHNRFDQYKEKQ